jgi:hypothetical protein
MSSRPGLRSDVGSVSARRAWDTTIVAAGARQLLLLVFLTGVPVVLTVAAWWLLAGPGRRVNAAVQAWLAPHLPRTGLGLSVLVAAVMAGFAAVTGLLVRGSDRRDAAEFEAWRQDWNTRADTRRLDRAVSGLADRYPVDSSARVRVRQVHPDRVDLVLGRGADRPGLPGRDGGAANVGAVLAVLTPVCAFAALVQVVVTGAADLLVPLAGIAAVSAWLLAVRLRYVHRSADAVRPRRMVPAPRQPTDPTGSTGSAAGVFGGEGA